MTNKNAFLNILNWRKRTPGYQDGNKNSMWKGGKRSWVERKARKQILKSNRRLDYCEFGKHIIKGRFNIHHKDGDRLNNHPENNEIHGRYKTRDKKGRFASKK